jgi:hypothetical protein
MAVLQRDGKIDGLFSDIVTPGSMNGAQLSVEARPNPPVAEGSADVPLHRFGIEHGPWRVRAGGGFHQPMPVT